MARSRSSRSKRGSKPAKSRRSKQTEEVVEEVEVVEEGRRLGIDDGMVIITFLMIVAAFFLTDYLLGTDYGQGMFFKDKFGT